MIVFRGYRHRPPQDQVDKGTAAPQGEPAYEGVIFSDGRCAVHWTTTPKSTSLWDSFKHFKVIHGHPEYETEIEWSKEAW